MWGMCSSRVHAGSRNTAPADQLLTTWAAGKATRQRAGQCPATPPTSTCRSFWALSKMAALLAPHRPGFSCNTGLRQPWPSGTTLVGRLSSPWSGAIHMLGHQAQRGCLASPPVGHRDARERQRLL